MIDDRIVLPRTDENGKPRVSYSQIKNFNEAKSFNLGVEGVLEYMAVYFYGNTFKDIGWGTFGQEVEDYIGDHTKGDNFTIEEANVLDTITPLDIQSDRFSIDFGEFELTGIIDDRTADWSKIRDYKTASKNSAKQYYEDEYVQLDLYALAGVQATAVIPKLEVCIVERKGNAMFGGGREALKVGKEVWYVERHTTEERLKALKQTIFETVVEISNYYKLFLKLNK